MEEKEYKIKVIMPDGTVHFLKTFYTNDSICVICGNPVKEDDYGNSDRCPNCGWKNEKDNEQWDKTMGISYPMLVSLSHAKEQYKNGQPFKASFEEFIKGLFFYSEMLFDYKGVTYEVFLRGNNDSNIIVFCCAEFEQEYETRDDFYNKANIDGKLLKDIWDEIENPGYMF